MLTINDIIESKNLNELYQHHLNLLKGIKIDKKELINKIRSFGFLDQKWLRGFENDPEIISELKKSKRFSLL